MREVALLYGTAIDELMGMEPDEVGMLLLPAFVAQEKAQQDLNEWTVVNDARSQAREGGADADLAVAAAAVIAEGWKWLENQGFLVMHPKNGGNWRVLSRAAKSVNPEDHVREGRSLGVLRNAELDPELRQHVFPNMRVGQYDVAVFAAFRLVEDRVRFEVNLGPSDIGSQMMKAVFRTPDGVLCDPALDRGEAVARMELFSGAIGTYKNPNSHRVAGPEAVQAEEAAEAVLLANNLLRILERAKRATRGRGRPRIRRSRMSMAM